MEQNTAIGIEFYQEKKFTEAIKHFSESSANDWIAQLYLAMSYYMNGTPPPAQIIFMRIKSECPDATIREKAEVAFAALRQTSRLGPREKAKPRHQTISADDITVFAEDN